ncbi:MAG TPA: permease [Thermoanaerobaculia bacterium]|jgi:hypothetical protein
MLKIAASFWALLASSSGFLILGLLAAGLVHALAHRFEPLRRAIPRGVKAIGFGIIAGLPLPVCSCGVTPVAMALRKRHAHPETIAAFVVSTPETSLDAVGLTAALLGLPFALLRIIAGIVAAFLAGIFVIATEALPARERAEPDDDEAHDHLRAMPLPDWWYRLIAWAAATWNDIFARPVEKAPGEAEVPAPALASTTLHRGRRTLVDALRIGFVETLDEIAWMLLIGFAVSAVVLALLPNDFVTRIPGGVAGQTLFGLAISLPLYVCASGSIPMAAALMAKGLSPVAMLTIFLIGPITNPATLLLLVRTFGRRFIVALIIAGLIAAILFGSLVTSAVKTPAPQMQEDGGEQSAGPGGWDVFFTVFFLPLFVLSLARAGWRRGMEDLRLAFGGLLPFEARRSIRNAGRLLALRWRVLAWSTAAAAVAIWIMAGCAIVPEGRVGFAESFGRASREPLAPGLHWAMPKPFGRVRLVDAASIVNVSVGFRPEGEAPNDLIVFTPAGDSAWHSAYTSQGSKPEESNYVTGDLNLVESKANLHLRVSDPRALAYQGGDPIETVRSLFQASLREILAARSIDDTLTTARGAIEEAARRDLQRRLAAARVPLVVISVNLLDLHPPDASVHAFRDISSAIEDRETRIHQARGKADAALPSARGEAAALMSSAESDRRENVARASGVSTAFVVQAGVAKKSAAAVRSMLRWDATDRLFSGKRIVIYPHGTPRDLFETPSGGFY